MVEFVGKLRHYGQARAHLDAGRHLQVREGGCEGGCVGGQGTRGGMRGRMCRRTGDARGDPLSSSIPRGVPSGVPSVLLHPSRRPLFLLSCSLSLSKTVPKASALPIAAVASLRARRRAAASSRRQPAARCGARLRRSGSRGAKAARPRDVQRHLHIYYILYCMYLVYSIM